MVSTHRSVDILALITGDFDDAEVFTNTRARAKPQSPVVE